MIPIRVIAISSDIAESVRKTMKDPGYGFPAYTEVATGGAPCRHCLRMISPGERWTLFTHDAFEGIEKLPLPGPVYVHAESCERYPEDGGFRAELRSSPRTLSAYARGAQLLVQEFVEDGDFDMGIKKLFARTDTDYIQVRSTTAGCYTLRVERADGLS